MDSKVRERILKFIGNYPKHNSDTDDELINILDDLVADYKGYEAANINNDGPEAQIDYLENSDA